MKTERKKYRAGARVLCGVGILLVVLAWFFGWLTLAEYRPEDVEALETVGEASQLLYPGGILTVMSWDTGYGALGDNADFFMDGGTHVYTADRERVLENTRTMIDTLAAYEPDVIFLQEVDVDSSRSRHVDEAQLFMDAFSGYQSTFAYNYRALFVPFPMPPLGKVNSGLLTLSSYPVSDSTRVQLPCPFSWPMRVANLKRCLMIDRVPVYGTDKELVLINLHLEAYDSGEGKLAQTEMLRDIMERELQAGNYVVAGGNFNQIFSSIENPFPSQEGMWLPGRIDVTVFGEGWRFLMDVSGPSCRSLDQPYHGAERESFQYYLIDGFIVSSNLEVLSVRTQQLGFVSSDHNPVVLLLRLPSA